MLAIGWQTTTCNVWNFVTETTDADIASMIGNFAVL